MRGHLVTKGSFYERLAEHGHEFIRDEDFRHLYSEGMGRPSIPPSVMIRAMLCATHDRTSDAETSRRTRVDLDWKAALGVEDDFGGIAARTFSLMRARMIAADADNEVFKAMLATAVAKGIFKGRLTAIIDSSPVMGAGGGAPSGPRVVTRQGEPIAEYAFVVTSSRTWQEGADRPVLGRSVATEGTSEQRVLAGSSHHRAGSQRDHEAGSTDGGC